MGIYLKIKDGKMDLLGYLLYDITDITDITGVLNIDSSIRTGILYYENLVDLPSPFTVNMVKLIKSTYYVNRKVFCFHEQILTIQ
ncbi:unnamed protein product [Rhizophagus irregularis]|nr:unnamed protein product [Rhizophagus irregularis]